MTTTRYSRLSIGLHWLMLLLLAAGYLCIEVRVLFERGSEPRELLKTLHFTLGLSVFALVWLRVLARAIHPPPPIEPPLPDGQRVLSMFMHASLYVLMVAMPIGGWLILSAEDKPVPFFGVTLPPLVAPDKNLATLVDGLHETLGTMGYWLIGVHAAAGLFHHYVRRDNTLVRMLPALSKK